MNYKDPHNKENLIQVKNKLISDLSIYLDELIAGDEHQYKEAAILYYSLTDRLNYFKLEPTFNPKYLPSYARGNLIKANFGYNVGSEFGGLHYCIVLHESNQQNPIASVLPLTSNKGRLYKSDINLGDEMYSLLMSKIKNTKIEIKKQSKQLSQTINRSNDIADKLFSLVKIEGFSIDENSFDLLGAAFYGSPQLKNLLKNVSTITKDFKFQLNELQQTKKSLDQTSREISKMKEGSIGIINQIRPISKMRIYKPKSKNDALYNISISDDTLDTINEKLSQYYLKPYK